MLSPFQLSYSLNS